MVLFRRKHHDRDVENGDPNLEHNRREEEESTRQSLHYYSSGFQGTIDSGLGYDKGDEYDNLLRYVADEAEKARRKRGDASDEERQYKRLWYAPWKKIQLKSEKERKACIPTETSVSVSKPG
jgi:H+-transporting ATPase